MTIIKTTKELGTEMRKARKLLGLTQSQLALTAGVGIRFTSQTTVTRDVISC
jgi:transcriptional regulator with XRE-family HTH domain